MPITIPSTAGDKSSVASASGTTIVVPKPANTADGDTLIAIIYHQLTGTGLTPPAGWTEIYHAVASGARAHYAYSKKVTTASGEPASWTWTSTGGSGRCLGLIFRVLGAKTTLIDALPASDVFPAGNGPVIPGLTAGTLAMLIGTVVTNNSTLISPHPTGAGFTELNWATAGSTGTSTLTVMAKQLVASGPTGDQALTWTADVATNTGAWMFALTGEAAAPVQTPLQKWAADVPAYAAHRDGFYATYGEFTLAGYGALKSWSTKVAWNIDIWKTLDNVWVASHDATTGRVLSGPSLDIRTSNWVDIKDKTTLVGNNPVATLDQIVAIAPYGTIFYVDNKGSADPATLQAKLTSLGLSAGNTVIKSFVTSGANNNFFRSAGFQLWLYMFDGDVAGGLSYIQAPDWIGFDYNGSQANWNTLIALGNKSFAHILPNLAAKATADSKAATAGGSNFGYMVSNIAAVVPKMPDTATKSTNDLKRDWLKVQTGTPDSSSLTNNEIEMLMYYGNSWGGSRLNNLSNGRYNYWKAIAAGAALPTDTVNDLERKAIIIVKSPVNPNSLTLDDLRRIYYTP